ncbi:hypothetical protein QWZ16_23385 [Vibrio ostreicida]|uniref:Uncharacterized protein n=1 Tax=Vibrio ostreicida TaxID=526588 RepID=A0ABT8C1R1_9VIBR|nr:hypothetical protein [Vibrio ostreicida]MDN3612546.1 hypothetical protein [Vibrio ostreicida]
MNNPVTSEYDVINGMGKVVICLGRCYPDLSRVCPLSKFMSIRPTFNRRNSWQRERRPKPRPPESQLRRNDISSAWSK